MFLNFKNGKIYSPFWKKPHFCMYKIPSFSNIWLAMKYIFPPPFHPIFLIHLSHFPNSFIRPWENASTPLIESKTICSFRHIPLPFETNTIFWICAHFGFSSSCDHMWSLSYQIHSTLHTHSSPNVYTSAIVVFVLLSDMRC